MQLAERASCGGVKRAVVVVVVCVCVFLFVFVCGVGLLPRV